MFSKTLKESLPFEKIVEEDKRNYLLIIINEA